MKFSYVLPDPTTYARWNEFENDLACMKQAGYDAVELQIADPIRFDAERVRRSLDVVGYSLCAFQTGSTYRTRGNCLCTRDEAVRQRTVGLLKSFVDLAAQEKSTIVFGSLQGRLDDEPDSAVGSARIRSAIQEIGQCATAKGVVVAFEPINHLEVGFHTTIGEVVRLVRDLNLPGLRMMVDTFHINIEEKDILAPLAGVRDILAHVHLCETNRGVLGDGHWPTAAFLAGLRDIGYEGYCSVGVYNTHCTRRESIERCMQELHRSSA